MLEMPGKPDRSAARKAAQEEKMRKLFEGRKYTIIKEVNLPADQRFRTPFGNTGRHGYGLAEVGNPENRFMVGVAVLKQAAERFGSVELPDNI